MEWSRPLTLCFLVGALLLLLLIASLTIGVIQSRQNRSSLSGAQAAAVGAALATWLVHTNLDFDWQMPGAKHSPGTHRVAAGQLLDACDCRGLRVGDAMVYEKHANIIDRRDRAANRDRPQRPGVRRVERHLVPAQGHSRTALGAAHGNRS